MSMPGFTAVTSLCTSASVHAAASPFAAPDLADRVVPQALPPCIEVCQQLWYDCIRGCQGWEWAVGSCPIKCRAGWVVCLGHVC
jgi:hypothetical protein